uniref:Uncharacterized protein n=1 Tax=Romanomermis culicivorax TaxID=13658 RepID=A0A915L6F3_ROMCU
MRQQCSAYFDLDILCDIDGMISEWSCLDFSTKISLQRYLPWKNSTSLYNYVDLFAETVMNRWFEKDRECKKPYFLFLIAAK